MAGPWIDMHAHPGRCFLVGLDSADPLVRRLGGDTAHAALELAHDAGLSAVTFSTVGDLRVLSADPVKGLVASRRFAPGEAREDHRRQLEGLVRLVQQCGAEVARTAADLERAHAEGQTSVIVSCEGGDFLELEPLTEAHAAGASSLCLVHYRVNDIGDTQTEEPVHNWLSAFGREVVAECNRLGMIIDCAHATFETTLGVLEASATPIMISHNHLDHEQRHHPRLLSAQHARVVASGGGLVGAWPSGVTSTTLDDFVVEIVRLIELIGVDHVGIGTDMDANYRPVLDSYSQFLALEASLAGHGATGAEIDKVLGRNAIELFGAARR